jgi:acyl-CoA thioester hydrolase
VGQPLVHTLRVRYGECDLQGVVFNAHYLGYFDISMTELWRSAFGTYQSMLDLGVDMVLAEARVRFRKPARFDDELSLAVAIVHLGTTSFATRHWIRRGDDLLAEGELRHVLVRLGTSEKTPIPEWARDRLAPWTVAERDDEAGERAGPG